MSEEERIAELASAVGLLRKSTENLAERANINRDNIERGKRRDKWLAASVILDIVLSVILAVGGNTLHHIANTQQHNTELNRDSQCAMVNMFLSYESATNRATNLTPEEKQQRADGYSVIHDIHDRLKCG